MLRKSKRNKPKHEKSNLTFLGTHAKIKSTIDDTYQSANRSLIVVETTKSEAIQTLNTLNHQGDQLKHIQGNVDEVLESEEKAKRSLSSIRSLFMTIYNYFRPDTAKVDNVKKGDKYKPKKKKSNKHKKANNHNKLDLEEYWLDFSELDKDDIQKNKKTNQIIDQISDGVDDLKGIAEDMGSELDEQNKRLTILNKTTNKANDTMQILTRGISSAT